MGTTGKEQFTNCAAPELLAEVERERWAPLQKKVMGTLGTFAARHLLYSSAS